LQIENTFYTYRCQDVVELRRPRRTLQVREKCKHILGRGVLEAHKKQTINKTGRDARSKFVRNVSISSGGGSRRYTHTNEGKKKKRNVSISSGGEVGSDFAIC
jgi:hypothetical protein